MHRQFYSNLAKHLFYPKNCLNIQFWRRMACVLIEPNTSAEYLTKRCYSTLFFPREKCILVLNLMNVYVILKRAGFGTNSITILFCCTFTVIFLKFKGPQSSISAVIQRTVQFLYDIHIILFTSVLTFSSAWSSMFHH